MSHPLTFEEVWIFALVLFMAAVLFVGLLRVLLYDFDHTGALAASQDDWGMLDPKETPKELADRLAAERHHAIP